MAWAVPQFRKGEIDRAGETLAGRRSETDFVHALEIISNWRSSHSYPLNTFQVTLRNKARSVHQDVLVAQRLKRLESIQSKLMRFDTLELSQMQDIGGCRAILKNKDNVYKLVEKYRNSEFAHKLKGKKDYIEDPKPDGYRSVHLIYQYKHRETESAYDGMRIEVQLRTALQHAWATAVEAVGTFTDQALKSNQGSADWRRFFALMGSEIAHIEGTAFVPDTPKSHRELIKEIKNLSGQLEVLRVL